MFRRFLLCFMVSVLVGCDGDGGNSLPSLGFEEDDYSALENTEIVIRSLAQDSDGYIASYEWSQLSGIEASITGSNTSVLRVLLPDVSEDEELLFQLTVTDNDDGISSAVVPVLVIASLADKSDIDVTQISENDRSGSVFISALELDIDATGVREISATVLPKPTTIADPFKVTFEIQAVEVTDTGALVLPIYGLYSSFLNQVDLVFTFIDDSQKTLSVPIATGSYDDARNVYDNIEVVRAPDLSAKPSFSYMLLKSAVSGPVIVDIDGHVRWLPQEGYDASNSTYINGKFYTTYGPNLITHRLDDTKVQRRMTQSPEFSTFNRVTTHHNVDEGKFGLLVEIDGYKDGVEHIESVLWETDLEGNVIAEWDFGAIIESYMLASGDDPSSFVRNGFDWCHMNSATYDREDDSILVSCREDFVIKVDYTSGEIQWVLGDETKYWYSFPSLQALSLYSNDTKPIGQHSLSIVNGELLLFNNGFFSIRQPQGAPRGSSLNTSRAARYAIDESLMSATLTWEFDPGLYSDVCSSVYKDSKSEGDYLINFAAINRTNGLVKKVILMGVTEEQESLFEYHLLSPEPPCLTAWNAEPISEFSDLYIR